jgi:hypothetical protein
LLSLDLSESVAHILKLDSPPCSQEPAFEEFVVGDYLPSLEKRVTDLTPEELQDAATLSSDLWVNCSASG